MPDADYNRKDYTGWEFISRPEYDWSGRTVTGACFSQETPDTQVFAPGTTGVMFVYCNLDNVLLPDGCKAVNCSQRRFEVQNDLRDWEVDEAGEPITVINEKMWKMRNYSVDPADIPDAEVEHIDAMRLEVLNGDVSLDDILRGETK